MAGVVALVGTLAGPDAAAAYATALGFCIDNEGVPPNADDPALLAAVQALADLLIPGPSSPRRSSAGTSSRPPSPRSSTCSCRPPSTPRAPSRCRCRSSPPRPPRALRPLRRPPSSRRPSQADRAGQPSCASRRRRRATGPGADPFGAAQRACPSTLSNDTATSRTTTASINSAAGRRGCAGCVDAPGVGPSPVAIGRAGVGDRCLDGPVDGLDGHGVGLFVRDLAEGASLVVTS